MIRTTSRSPLQADLIKIYRQALQSGVALEQVEEKIRRFQDRIEVTDRIESQQVKDKKTTIKKQLPLLVRTLSVAVPGALLLTGIFLIGSAIVPISGYYLSSISEFRVRQLQSPIPPEQIIQGFPKAIAQTIEVDDASYFDQAPTVITDALDFTNLNNWFVGMQATDASEEHEYILDIPSINIKNAKVTLGGSNLNTSLIQYPGTADPGKPGAPVIFGHSVLRQFYNPEEENKRRYVSIFSYIMTLKKGDKIYVKDGSVSFVYEVVEKMEVKPEDVYILAQNSQENLLKLVTCVPEGTFLRRGVVIAQLVQSNK